MGNRCVITTEEREVSVYLHWNGGYESVRAFLKYCELRGFRTPDSDSYGWARLCQVVANFFGADGLSIGISPYTNDSDEDPGDNGIYVIKGWKVDYNLCDGEKKTYDELESEYGKLEGDELKKCLRTIDVAQPKLQQLGDFINAELVPISSIKKGQILYNLNFSRWISSPCLGFGDDRIVNGRNVKGYPFADFLNLMEVPIDPDEAIQRVRDNINSYVGFNCDTKGLCWALPMQEDEGCK